MVTFAPDFENLPTPTEREAAKEELTKFEKTLKTLSSTENTSSSPSSGSTEKWVNTNDQFLKIVKNITSKGFIRSNYEEKLVDLSDVRINLKSKS